MTKVAGSAIMAAVVSIAAAACSTTTTPECAISEPAGSRGHGLRARRAEVGIAISPFAIDTSHMSRDEELRVGLGSYIANATSDCGGCHSSPAGFLAGGTPFNVDASGHVVYARNLTTDPTTGLRMTQAELRAVIRTGKDLHQDRTKQLVVMPWPIFRWMGDADIDALYAYLRTVPAVANDVPVGNKDGLALPASTPFPGYYNDGDLERPLPPNRSSFDPARGLAIAPLATPPELHCDTRSDYALGSYIANSMADCEGCHTHPDRTPAFKINTSAYLLGGTVFDVPPPVQPVVGQVRSMSVNLKGEVHGFFNEPEDSFARFKAIITTGTHADELPPRPLGWPMTIIAANLSNLIDEDLESVYTYVKHAPSISGALDQERQSYARYCVADASCNAGESCALATSECVGSACGSELDCDACQTCTNGVCTAPVATSACLAGTTAAAVAAIARRSWRGQVTAVLPVQRH